MHDTPPYGYRYVSQDESGGGDYWMIDEREADAIHQIFAWYTENEQLTLWQITKCLNQHLQCITYIGRRYFNQKRVDPNSQGTPLKIGHGYRKSTKLIMHPQSNTSFLLMILVGYFPAAYPANTPFRLENHSV